MSTRFFLLMSTLLLILGCKSSQQPSTSPTNSSKATLQVNIDSSKIYWTGSKTSGQHQGELSLKSGWLKTKNGEIQAGEFVMDMNSINDTDLPKGTKEKLEAHLKSADFFEVEKYPEAYFKITEVHRVFHIKASHMINGKLTIKDIEVPVSILAQVSFDGNTLKAITPDFTINRFDWGIDWENPIKESALNKEIKIIIKLKAEVEN